MLTGWRIAAPDHAHNPEEMMSGEGAFRYGGRWNSKGTRVVYLGTSIAQAAMELLVHLGRADILRQFNKMEVAFDESHMQHISIADLPDNWSQPSMASSVQDVGDAWVRDLSSLILQVPSAAVTGEFNYLVNPNHDEVASLTYSVITPFGYDPRLSKA